MYGLPADFDGDFLIGRTLEQICLNQNQIALHFDGDVDLTLEGEYTYRGVLSRADEKSAPLKVPVFDSNLAQFVGQVVMKATGTKDGTLTLVFQRDDRLLCFDTPYYESYQIRHGQRVIVV